MRILVVEDHAELAHSVARVLRREGMAVDVVYDGSDALDRTTLSAEAVARLRTVRDEGGIARPFPACADDFFRADLIEIDGTATLDACFGILVVLGGKGQLRTGDSVIDVTSGETVLLPHGAGEIILTGTLSAIRARPPAP